jgi:hypothetical protein
MTDYDYDDPDRERGAVVKAWRDEGFPASVPAALLTELTAEGVDLIEACRRVMGALATALDPEYDALMAAASDEDRFDSDEEVDERNAARHEYQRWITHACLAHMTPDELLAVRRAWRESTGDELDDNAD